jgi:hypothetical protein
LAGERDVPVAVFGVTPETVSQTEWCHRSTDCPNARPRFGPQRGARPASLKIYPDLFSPYHPLPGMSRFGTVLDKSRGFHDHGCTANGYGWTIYGYGYDLFWHDDDGFNDILMFFADFNPELAKFIYQAATGRACQTISGAGVLAHGHPSHRPRGAGIPPAGLAGRPAR